MSRAFVKEDADNERVLVPERAPLPEGTPNLVTPQGMAAMRDERAAVQAELATLQARGPDEPGHARDVSAAQERLAALEDRLASAQVVEPAAGRPATVAFGTTVTVRTLTGKFAGEQSRFTIVGVDEADPFEGRVAFTAPTAAALLGRAVGERVRIATGGPEQLLEVAAIDR